MSDARSLPRWKRFFLCISLLICLFTVNFSLFSLRVRANVSEGYGSREYVLGVPFDIIFTVPPSEFLGNSDLLYGSLLDVTKFYANDDGTVSVDTGSAVTWNRTSDGFPVLLWDVRNVSSSDSYLRIMYRNSLNCIVNAFSSEEDFIINVDDPYSDGLNPGWELSSTVSRSFSFNVLFPYYDSTLSIIGIGSRLLSIPSFDSSSWSYVIPYGKLFDVYNSQELPYFYGNDGKRYLWIDSWTCSLNSLALSSYVFSSGSNFPSYSYYDILSSRMQAIIDDDVAMSVNFDDISWTDWLVDSVGSFMNFQIVPGLSISGMFALLIGMSLFMTFLKVFAGG